ncbi:MAG TPA: hypothetical protein PKD64_15610 [Pirellulaceae bacterium]|nr:hypothetical protein [Pirellulaceae bacterium]HMO93613.1 hypothetical protein [Pirellulaceae bacterium]HMP70485.1 hypothetical protein [Pirellulaceae bacterium]
MFLVHYRHYYSNFQQYTCLYQVTPPWKNHVGVPVSIANSGRVFAIRDNLYQFTLFATWQQPTSARDNVKNIQGATSDS